MSTLALLVSLLVIQCMTLPITVNILPPATIQLLWDRNNPQSSYETVHGYTAWEADSLPRCCVITVPPLEHATLGTWQHEIKHCTKGYWHEQG